MLWWCNQNKLLMMQWLFCQMLRKDTLLVNTRGNIWSVPREFKIWFYLYLLSLSVIVILYATSYYDQICYKKVLLYLNMINIATQQIQLVLSLADITVMLHRHSSYTCRSCVILYPYSSLSFRWLGSRLQYLQCISNGDIAVLHQAINVIIPCVAQNISG